jgi:beta-glucosidase
MEEDSVTPSFAAAKWCLLLMFAFVSLLISLPGQTGNGGMTGSVYRDGWIDHNRNGVMDPYENPKLENEQRITDLIARMTIEEKTMQLVTLYGFNRVLKDPLPTAAWKNSPWKDGIANIDEQCNGVRDYGESFARPPSRHAEVINTIQQWFIEETRLGIPVDFTNEGIRGLAHWGATSLPNQVGMASTWDRELVSQAGRLTGREARALGYTNVYSPILDLARDPRWGRVVETYGEDPYLVGELGIEQVKGIQSERVVSTPKHFAVYSVPKGGRDGDVRTDPHASLREVETVLLAPFRAAFLRGGALGTMASYNDYNGIPVIGNPEFLMRRLRGEYGFRGYVVSDSGAVEMLDSKHFVSPDRKHSAAMVLNAGLNVRTDFTDPMEYVQPLRDAIKEGLVSARTIDSRVRDVLRVKYWLNLFDQPFIDPAPANSIVRAPSHLETARRASRESLVLLKNENGTLPLSKQIKSILVTGPLSEDTSFAENRYGPHKPETISITTALKNLLGTSIEVKQTKGCDFVQANWPATEIFPDPLSAEEQAGIQRAVEMAGSVDAVVVCVGENDKMVGEGFSRSSLDLPSPQIDLVKALKATGKPVVVVLMNGRALSINWIDANIPAILEAWNPGEFGPQAISEVLFGDYNPGGKLPVTFPRTVGQIPWNFPAMPSSQHPQKNGSWKGNTEIDGVIYPFGYGLSYTTFEFSNLEIFPAQQKAGDNITVTFDVKNAGRRAGSTVAQLYLRDEVSSVISHEKVLRGFERIELGPGQSKKLRFVLSPADLQLLDASMHWAVEPGWFTVTAGDSSENTPLKGRFEITQRESPRPTP